ncbi:MAG TPA: hypothetical protein VHW01_28720 [Polyangiaceae bacterium]|nr:hypothetical protein [Polyangiaceae bacterium]
MFWRAVRVVFTCGVAAAVAAPACGGSSSNSGEPGDGGAGAGGSSHGAGGKSSGGAGKAGSSGVPAAVPCGNQMCKGVTIPIPTAPLQAPGCCADAKTNTCGIDTSALPAMASGQGLPACQPVAPAGKPDATCASSPVISVMGIPVTAPGCCTPSDVCGYDLDRVGGLFSLGLGCIDSTPFADAGTAVTCGANTTGDGGMGGAGPEQTGDGGMSRAAGSGASGN